MAARKPPGLSWSSWIEQAIQRAQENGEFDDLPGRGKPLGNLDEGYDPSWWAAQLLKREKLSLLPPALAIRQRADRELTRIRKLRREPDVRTALAALNEEIARVNRTVSAGPATSVATVDIEAFMARWRSETS